MPNSFAGIIGPGRVVPVLTINRADDAVPLAQALVRGGLSVIEVTLRSEAALPAIRAIAREVRDAVVGAGTVLKANDLAKAADEGARFIVSPGYSDAVVDESIRRGLPVLAGVATATEVMHGLDRGLTEFKFFPSMALGTITLSHVYGPLPQARFCCTGGLDQNSAPEFLAQPNVFCVGGNWMAPRDIVARGDWDAVEALARKAASL